MTGDASITDDRERSAQYLHLLPGADLPILINQPSQVIVVIDAPVDQEWQAEVSRWLIRCGCLYMLAWGRDCSTWDDSVDLANAEAHDFGFIPENRDTMTTWHADEPIEECLWFAKHCAVHPTVTLTRTLILHIADRPDGRTILRKHADA